MVRLRLWHKMDKAFKTPRESVRRALFSSRHVGQVLAQVHTAAYDLGPEAVAMMRLFCGVVTDDLNTFAYDANVAQWGPWL